MLLDGHQCGSKAVGNEIAARLLMRATMSRAHPSEDFQRLLLTRAAWLNYRLGLKEDTKLVGSG